MGGGDLKSYSNLAKFKKLEFNALSDDEQKEGFIFHLISNDISELSQSKLKALAKDLNLLYPCEIKVHICDEKDFEQFPTFRGNHSAYFRFLIPHFMPENAKICLYLDVDMLCMQDLRELFTLDLKDKIVGVVLDTLYWHTYKPYSKSKSALSFDFKGFYFNSGFLLFNLDEVKRQDIFQKMSAYLSHYRSSAHDQDALSAIVKKEQALILPLEYNCLTHLYYPSIFADFLVYEFAMPYSQKEQIFALKNPIILHWAGDGKPYHNEHWRINKQNELVGLLWWKIAFQTPIFQDELKAIFLNKKENFYACKEFGLFIASLIMQSQQSFFGLFKMPFVVYKAFKEFDLNKNYTLNASNLDQNLVCELFFIALKAFCRSRFRSRLEQFICLPYKAYRAKKRCKKGNFRAKREAFYDELFNG